VDALLLAGRATKEWYMAQEHVYALWHAGLKAFTSEQACQYGKFVVSANAG